MTAPVTTIDPDRGDLVRIRLVLMIRDFKLQRRGLPHHASTSKQGEDHLYFTFSHGLDVNVISVGSESDDPCGGPGSEPSLDRILSPERERCPPPVMKRGVMATSSP